MKSPRQPLHEVEPLSRVGPTTRADLVEHLATGCKPVGQHAFGVEHEVLAYDASSGQRLRYEGPDGIEGFLVRLADRMGGTVLAEKARPVGVKIQNEGHVTLEPGGQIEFSGVPCRDITVLAAQTARAAQALREVAADRGVRLVACGYDPFPETEAVPHVPKDRYTIMRAHMPTAGDRGLDMMHRTCSAQVNLDYETEESMVRSVRVATAVQPVVAALCANSPIRSGEVTPWPSVRAQAWASTDPTRTGPLDVAFESGFGFERYVDSALSVPMYFVRRGSAYTDARGRSFADFLAGRLDVLPGERPTWADWNDHLGVIFTEVRLRPYLEIRGADVCSAGLLCALPAFWGGLLYDEASATEASRYVDSWSASERTGLHRDAQDRGLRATFRGEPITALAATLLDLAEAGLERRDAASGGNEAAFLDPLRRIAESGRTGADAVRALAVGPPDRWADAVSHLLRY